MQNILFIVSGCTTYWYYIFQPFTVDIYFFVGIFFFFFLFFKCSSGQQIDIDTFFLFVECCMFLWWCLYTQLILTQLWFVECCMFLWWCLYTQLILTQLWFVIECCMFLWWCLYTHTYFVYGVLYVSMLLSVYTIDINTASIWKVVYVSVMSVSVAGVDEIYIMYWRFYLIACYCLSVFQLYVLNTLFSGALSQFYLELVKIGVRIDPLHLLACHNKQLNTGTGGDRG
jgi:hypothetical protein